jgi:hypothetical protein
LLKITPFVMGTVMVPETPAIFKQVKRLITRDVLLTVAAVKASVRTYTFPNHISRKMAGHGSREI